MPVLESEIDQAAQSSRRNTIDGTPSPVRPAPWAMSPDSERSIFSASRQPGSPVQRSKSYRDWSGIERDQNISVSQRKPIDGYPKLAEFLGRYKGFAIFRRFASLNARNLLYLQVEILELEEELNKLEEAHSMHDDLRNVLFNWEALKLSEEGTTGKLQYDIIMELRVRLKEYNGLLLEHHQLYQLPEPSDQDVANTLNHIQNGYGVRDEDWLDALECRVWKVREKNGKPGRVEKVEKDLVSLSGDADSDTDRFTRILRKSVVTPFYKRFGKPNEEDNEIGLHMYDGKILDKIAGNVVVVLASVLPICSIFALYFIPTMVWRLAFITVWSVIFSMCIAMFTVASRVEIFQASVAMAAVQVVFISTNTNGCGV
ncbi:hypothetical protein MMC18_002253 [Xylographa bjoerkii]|nr:hypothetical protein [Xylographa bjoerkii]